MRSSREELKKYFKNGCVPTEANFADLIDSMAHRDELSANDSCTPSPTPMPTPTPAPSPGTPAPAPAPAASDFSLMAKGWSAAAGRIGIYDHSMAEVKNMKPAAQIASGVAADGAWHPILRGLNDSYAFEIVACASGSSRSANHAVTHALALMSFGGSGNSIRQTCTTGTWWAFFFPRICFKWQKKKGSTLSDLCIRTRSDYGLDDQGVPVRLFYHITRLW
jgi:hypothetical protein